jgi:1,2-diacylglycerol 3-alpha-glucosyltransferase
MNIALIADFYGQHNNGTSVTAARLVKNLRAKGHEVTVISPYECREEGYVQLEKMHIPFFGEYIEGKNGIVFARVDEEILLKVIRDSDIVHVLMPFSAGSAAARLACESGVPLIISFHVQPENITSHMFLMNSKLVNRFIYRVFWNHCYKYTRFIHCPSNFIAGELIHNGYYANLRVVSNGVIPIFHKKESCKPPEFQDKICILFIGRFADEKRHDLLVDAAAISKYADKIQLIFAGNGPREDKIKKRSQKLSNEPLLKLMTEEELSLVINYCDLYVHPSDVDIEAISCIEAFSCGLVPVISDSRRSATKQFALTPENEFAAGDPNSLAEKIDYWLDHPAEKEELSHRYIEFGKNYEINTCVDQMEQIYYEVIADHAREKTSQEVLNESN